MITGVNEHIRKRFVHHCAGAGNQPIWNSFDPMELHVEVVYGMDGKFERAYIPFNEYLTARFCPMCGEKLDWPERLKFTRSKE